MFVVLENVKKCMNMDGGSQCQGLGQKSQKNQE